MTSRMLAVIVATACLASPSPYVPAQSPITSAAPRLQDLRGIAEIRSLFDSDRDKVRIVLLLSPT